MAQFTMFFTIRHRKDYAVEYDCTLISECITKYITDFKYFYNGKGLIIFHVYGANKKARVNILTLIFERLQSLTYWQSIDLQYYTKD